MVEIELSLLNRPKLPIQFWSNAFDTTKFLINRMPVATKNDDFPYSKLFGTTPDYLSLHIFGCLCYPWLYPYSSHKLHYHCHNCIFLGYSRVHKGYRCFDPILTKSFISRHVVFDEQVFPYSELSEPVPPTTLSVPDINQLLYF